MSAPLEVAILAAGKGTRMHSERPKVLQDLGGKALLEHVLDCAKRIGADATHVVYGHGGDDVPDSFPSTGVNWICQSEQLGTGHAVMQVLPHTAPDAIVVVMYGDVPLISARTLQALAEAAADSLAILTVELDDPQGYGRIIRDSDGQIMRIVEQRDATATELAIREVNTGFIVAPAARLRDWLARTNNDNAQGEYYLTDVVGLAVADGIRISDRQPADRWEVLGVNSKSELAKLERKYQQQQAERLMSQGVTLRDPNRIDIRGEVVAGRDCVIDVNVVLEGKVTLADGVTVGPNNFIRDSNIGPGVAVLPNCVIEEANIAQGCRIGPFSRIRPGTELGPGVNIGNFVETKNSKIAAGSKVNHLSYVGDSDVGRDVNIGAGVITCNYDGANKHRTQIEDGVFVGSDCQLVAPVKIGESATIGAGSTIVKDVPAGGLTFSRAKQRTVSGWQRPKKGK
ncbi:MAG: bifunctional UDP-N-acetylglucosamine diphosphorylase/glucosamine-1-phosphate N-acetyltransferase GlmU [Gammaproteobacteria bacterium]|nr:bifunctional UDP-N-acetylglucosamine diphosphorylase/glucosamine-1-phosphate N-acetyltransferase GlmU [Gammaproteobacteria bacterium]